MSEEKNIFGFENDADKKEEPVVDIMSQEQPIPEADQEKSEASEEVTSPVTEEPEVVTESAPESAPVQPNPTVSQWQKNGGAYQTPPYQGQPYGGQYSAQPQPPYGQPPQNSPFQQNNWNGSNYHYPHPPQPNKPKQNKGLAIFSIILAAALFLTAVFFVGYAISTNGKGGATSNSSMSNVSLPNLELNSRPAENPVLTEDGALTDTAIAKKVKPSVVGITTYVKSRNQYQSYGAGSGIVFTKDGYIVTNAHVIMVESTGEPVDRIQVYLDNEESYSGIIVGADSRSDLAVIKIKANNLTPAEFGDSTTVEVGEHVLAIGNPSGLQLSGSVTDGIVSGVDRTIRSSSTGYSMSCIQTNAAINPGNSGGALVNVYGQVIGINSSKIVADGYEGIGFAIAISEAKPIIDSLISNGYVEGRVKIGITYVVVDDFTAALNQVPKGLQVAGIDETLPVAESGLRVYDIITQLDGKSVTSTQDVTEFLRNKKPGDTVKITVYRINDDRTNQTLTITTTLSEDRGESVDNTEEN